MKKIGESINDGDFCLGRKILHHFVRKSANHNPIDITGHHLGRIANRLATRELEFSSRKEDRLTAQLGHPCFKGYTGSCRRFIENQTDRFARKRRPGFPPLVPLLQFRGMGQEFIDFFFCPVKEGEKILFHGFHPDPYRTHDASFPSICVPIPPSVKISKRIACSTRPSMIWVFWTPCLSASMQQ